MSRLTRQEQLAVWILLVLITGGALGRHLIRHRDAAPTATAPTAYSR